MKISEWPNAPQWLRDARTENADVEISESGYVTWRGGTWHGGDWWGGDWLGGKVNEIEGAKVIITFAHCDGWPKTLVDVNGEAWILAGCRWFNFADARKHWAGREDRIMTRALLHGAYHLAKHMGLKCE